MIKQNFKLLTAMAVLVVVGVRTADAQQLSDDVTLNVTLVEVQNISVEHDVVHLTFDEANDYLNGVNTLLTSHLKVSSTGEFLIKVNTSAATLANGTNTIPASTITVTPAYISGTDPGATVTTAALSTTATTILSASSGTTQAFYNVTYDASGGPDYIDKPAGTYTTTVTYTISPT